MDVSEIMTSAVVSVTPETTLKQVAALLAERRIAGVPVCRSDGELVGVISEGDILWKETGLAPARDGLLTRILNAADHEDDKLGARTAGEAMSSPAITVAANAAAAQAARLMIDHHVNRLPVLADGKLVGIIARSDLVRAFVRSDAEIAREIEQDVLLGVLWIEPETLGVSVEAGEVRLSGQVDNRSTAELVETYVRRIPGVVALNASLSWKFDDLARRVSVAAKVLPHKL